MRLIKDDLWDSENNKFNSFIIDADNFLNLNSNNNVTETFSSFTGYSISDTNIISSCSITDKNITCTPTLSVIKSGSRYITTLKLDAVLDVVRKDSNRTDVTSKENRSYYVKVILEPEISDTLHRLYITYYTYILNLEGTWNTSNRSFNSFEISTDSFLNLTYKDTLKSLTFISSSNNGIISNCTVSSTYDKITCIPTSNVEKSNTKYNVTLKFQANIETDGTSTIKDYFLKLVLKPEINDYIYKLNVTHYEGKLDPATYLNEKSKETDNLDSLVTKRGLISNLSELANQVSTKVSNIQVFAIRYDLQGGSWENGNEGRTSFVNSIAYCAPQPVRVGYTFLGWNIYRINTDSYNENTQLNSKTSTDAMIPIGTNFDVVAVANWDANKYQISCKNNNGNSYYEPWIIYGENATLNDKSKGLYTKNSDNSFTEIESNITDPTKSGYNFSKWSVISSITNQTVYYSNNNSLDTLYNQLFKASNNYNEDGLKIQLTPVFEPKVFTLKYNLNGGILPDSKNTNINTYTFDTTLTLPIPTKDGYKFTGWDIFGNIAENNSSSLLTKQFVLNPNELSNVYDDTVTLIATWEVVKYHLDFDTQGGIMSSSEDDWTLEPNRSYIIENPTKSGYTFNGWTVIGGDNNGTTAADKDSNNKTYNSPSNINHDVTLRANWSAGKSNYTLEIWTETVDSTGSYSSSTQDTCTYELTSSAIKSTDTDTDLSTSNTSFYTTQNYITKLGVTVPTGFALSKILGTKAYANGTGYIKIYFHRDSVDLQVIDKLQNINTGYTDNYRTDIATFGNTTSTNKIQNLKFGQTKVVSAIFSNNNPSNGFTVDKDYQTITLGKSNNTITFIYTRRLFTAIFKRNGVCTFKNDPYKSADEYSVTNIAYGANLSKIPEITNNNNISSSKWIIGTNQYNDSGDNAITSYTVISDTTILRIGNYKEYTISISNTGIDNKDVTVSSNDLPEVSNDKLNGSKLPYSLPILNKEGYNFLGWKFSISEIFSNDNYIKEITLDLIGQDATNIFLQACFERAEPSLSISGTTTFSFSGNTLTVSNLTLNKGANTVYLTTKDQNFGDGINATINATNNGTTYTFTSISPALNIIKNDKIILTAAKKVETNTYYYGKSYIGTISSISNNVVAINSWSETSNTTTTNNNSYIKSIAPSDAATTGSTEFTVTKGDGTTATFKTKDTTYTSLADATGTINGNNLTITTLSTLSSGSIFSLEITESGTANSYILATTGNGGTLKINGNIPTTTSSTNLPKGIYLAQFSDTNTININTDGKLHIDIAGNATTATDINSSGIGDNKKPVYVNKFGKLTVIGEENENIGSNTKPIYWDANDGFTAGSLYAGGTKIESFNGADINDSKISSIYAPSAKPSDNQLIYATKSSSTPTWGTVSLVGINGNTSLALKVGNTTFATIAAGTLRSIINTSANYFLNVTITTNSEDNSKNVKVDLCDASAAETTDAISITAGTDISCKVLIDDVSNITYKNNESAYTEANNLITTTIQSSSSSFASKSFIFKSNNTNITITRGFTFIFIYNNVSYSRYVNIEFTATNSSNNS